MLLDVGRGRRTITAVGFSNVRVGTAGAAGAAGTALPGRASWEAARGSTLADLLGGRCLLGRGEPMDADPLEPVADLLDTLCAP